MSFHDLHHQGVPFVLPNAWDVPSALAYLAEGFTAIGTTSFGVSSSGGHPDGHRATRGANIALAAALAPLQCYVSVDIEDGYSDEPDAIADYVAQLSTAGINIEDSSAEKLIDPALAAAKIVAIKQRNPEVFVNARVGYPVREHPAALMLGAQDRGDVRELAGLFQLGEDVLLFQLSVVVLDEASNDLRAFVQCWSGTLIIGLEAADPLAIDQQDAFEHSVFAHQVLGRGDRDFLFRGCVGPAFAGLGRRPTTRRKRDHTGCGC